MSYTVDDLAYDPVAHRSTFPDGREVPHVTGVLKAVGVGQDFDALAGISDALSDAIDFARDRGTAMHADCHAFDDGDLDWATVHPAVRPYVEAWSTCRANMGFVPLTRERRVYHPLYNYTGILDGVVRYGDKIILPDLKSGDPESAAGHLQTAAYEAAYRAQHPEAEHVDERWAIWLQPGARVPYKIVNYSARPDAYLDFQKWLSCLTVYHEQHARRRRR